MSLVRSKFDSASLASGIASIEDLSEERPSRDQRYQEEQDSQEEEKVQCSFPHRDFVGKQFAFLGRE